MAIKTRTIFVDNRNGQCRFLDFALVGTSLGTMVEPRQLSVFPRDSKAGFTNFDPNDECALITKISSAEQRQKRTLFNGLHGGEQIPQEYGY